MYRFSCMAGRSAFVDGKLTGEVFTLETDSPTFDNADVNRIVYEDGAWKQELPSEVEVSEVRQHVREWSRPVGYEIRYR